MHSHYPRLGDRPGQQRLRAAWRDFEGDNDRAKLRQVQESVAKELIEEQEGCGLKQVTDGMPRWGDSVSYFMSCLDGIEAHGGLLRYFDTNTYFRQPKIVETPVWSSSFLKDEWQFLLRTAKQPIKLVVTGPYTLATLCSVNRAVDRDTLTFQIEELARALSFEISAFVSTVPRERLGMVQIDEPMILQHPGDMALLKTGLDIIRKNCSTVLYLTLATYFGDAAGCFEALQKLPVDCLGLDFTYSERLPALISTRGSDKDLMLGLLDGRNTKMENLEATAQMIGSLARRLESKRVYLTTSCGLEYLPRDAAEAKLRLTAQIAERCNKA